MPLVQAPCGAALQDVRARRSVVRFDDRRLQDSASDALPLYGRGQVEVLDPARGVVGACREASGIRPVDQGYSASLAGVQA